MQGREREIDTLSVRRPQPHTTNLFMKRRERKIVKEKKGESNQANKKALDLLLKPANPTPSKTGSTRSFQRDTAGEGNKSSQIMRGSAAGRRISIPMCDQNTVCNPDWHIRHRQSATKWVQWVTPDLVQHTQQCHRSTVGKITVKHATS